MWAYVLFSISVQLKLYPLIFAVMFIRDWRDWRHNVKRLSLLALGNFGLFFVLGWRVFLDFVDAVRATSVRMNVISVFNHSIHSFVSLAATIAGATGSSWSALRTTTAEAELFAIVAICIALIVVKAWRENTIGVNPELLVACAVARF